MTDVDILSNQGLIKTKYCKPIICQYLIPRKRLYKKLEQSVRHKLTLISAPAGYGKTTAVVEWLEVTGLPFVWVSLDSRDNEPILFWKYITAALEEITEGIEKDTSYVFSSRELFNSNIHLSILIEKLSLIKSDFLLVLDDFHLITEQTILEDLSYLISFLPPKMHIILISRSEPDLGLAKFDLKSNLVRLNLEDLRFRTEEISSFYEARELNLENSDLQRVENYTEGWAAALVAVAMSIQNNADKHKSTDFLKSCDRHIERFLQEEVFSTWTKDKQEFFLKTSILDKLYGPLCDEVTGLNRSSKLLKEISESNGFLLSLDDENSWYRYHNLFADFLRRRLLDENCGSISQLHEKAAGWYKANGLVQQAVEHYLDACRFEESVELIEAKIAYLIMKDDYSAIIPLIERLPEEYIQRSLEINAGLVFYYTETDEYELAAKHITNLRTVAESDRYTVSENTKEYAKKVYNLIKANLIIRQGDINGFLSLIEESSKLNVVNEIFDNDFFNINRFDINLYRNPMNKLIQILRNDPESYFGLVRNYRTLIGKYPGFASLMAGEFYYEINRFDEAVKYLLAAIDEAMEVCCPGAFVPAMVTIACIKRAKGDIKGAFQIVKECESKIMNCGEPHWRYMLDSFKARLYLDSGDMDKAEKWSASSKIGLFQEITKAREYELIVLARVLIKSGRFDDALMLLKRLYAFARSKARLHSTVEILNLLSITANEIGDTDGAMLYIEEALFIGMEEGYIRSFADEFESMRGIIGNYIIRRGKQTENKNEDRLVVYAQNLLNHIKDNIGIVSTEERSEQVNRLIKLLTPQEQKVLCLLVDAYTNNEIAKELGVTLRTVKAHIGSIYWKIGVKNRMQCLKVIGKSRLS